MGERIYKAQHLFVVSWIDFAGRMEPSSFCASCGNSFANHEYLPYGWPDPERRQVRLV